MKEGIDLRIKGIKTLVARAETRKAIDTLLEFLNDESSLSYFQDTAIMISSQYFEFNNSKQKGLISNNEELIRINNSILELLKVIQEQKINEPSGLEEKILEFYRKSLLAESEMDIKKIIHEFGRLKPKYPNSFEVEQFQEYIHKLKRRNELLLIASKVSTNQKINKLDLIRTAYKKPVDKNKVNYTTKSSYESELESIEKYLELNNKWKNANDTQTGLKFN